MPRGTSNTPLDPVTVTNAVRAKLGAAPPVAPEPSPLDDLPADPGADMVATRAVLARLR